MVLSLPRTHFFSANPLFRISAINSEGCIDGPVRTNHSFRTNNVWSPPLWEMYTSGFVNTKTHQINSLVSQLGKVYTVSFCRSRGFNQSKQIITFSHQHKSIYLSSAATYILLYWLSQETLPQHWFMWITKHNNTNWETSIKVHHTTSTNSKLKGYFSQKGGWTTVFLWLSGRTLRLQRKRLWVRFPGNTQNEKMYNLECTVSRFG